MSSPEPLLPGTSDSREPFSFVEFASGLGLNKFAAALEAANLTSSYVDVCQSELTLFAPTDDAFDRLGANLPTDVLLLRELMCVHITLGNFSGVAASMPPFTSRLPRLVPLWKPCLEDPLS